MTADTATLSYWLNWRFSLCALFILTTMAVAAIIIWKFEGRKKSEHEDRDNDKEAPGHLYEDEAWNTCLRSIHPAWLLSFRVFAFIMLLALLLANVAIEGSGIFLFLFLNRWTYTLVTMYFGFGSAVSVYGCQKHWGKVGGDRGDHLSLDSEHGSYTPPILGEAANVSNQCKHFDAHRAPHCPPRAGVWTYAFQIIYQTSAGAVILTDSVFWFILFPLLKSKDYGLNFVSMKLQTLVVPEIFLLLVGTFVAIYMFKPLCSNGLNVIHFKMERS
ncbi:hypothetical protein Gohar_009310 [Gossypium harknessii]|uniref:Uncharacterized protein n=1 Tax=Gossypium harknessii TaxID=34285 RepID=A0A7J9GMH6_9ROSI|nr:hypothetical protein [Gossypium harknessii]